MIVNEDIEKLKKYFVERGKKFTQAVQSIISWGNISGKPTQYPPEDHASNHAVGGGDSVFPADPNADKILQWDDSEGQLVWVDIPAGSGALNNFIAVTDPANTNDETEGYEIGSQWLNTVSGALFECTDATGDNAVWKQINSVIVDDAPSDGNTYGRKNGTWAMVSVTGGGQIVLSTVIGEYETLINSVFNPTMCVSEITIVDI